MEIILKTLLRFFDKQQRLHNDGARNPQPQEETHIN